MQSDIASDVRKTLTEAISTYEKMNMISAAMIDVKRSPVKSNYYLCRLCFDLTVKSMADAESKMEIPLEESSGTPSSHPAAQEALSGAPPAHDVAPTQEPSLGAAGGSSSTNGDMLISSELQKMKEAADKTRRMSTEDQA